MNEYQSLRDACFFRWATLDLASYVMRMALLWSLGALICFPVASYSFALDEFPVKCILATIAGATIWLALILSRLYLGWSYVCDRLLSQSVVYEETGWYDGQSWKKPAEELAKHQLVGLYQIRPILRRLRYSFAVLLGVFLVSGTCMWAWL